MHIKHQLLCAMHAPSIKHDANHAPCMRNAKKKFPLPGAHGAAPALMAYSKWALKIPIKKSSKDMCHERPDYLPAVMMTACYSLIPPLSDAISLCGYHLFPINNQYVLDKLYCWFTGYSKQLNWQFENQYYKSLINKCRSLLNPGSQSVQPKSVACTTQVRRLVNPGPQSAQPRLDASWSTHVSLFLSLLFCLTSYQLICQK